MRAWPRTLFYRHLLLIIVLIVLAQLASAALFRQWVIKPRVQVAGEAAGRHVQALQASMATLPPTQRSAFVAQLNAHARAQTSAQAQDLPAVPDRQRPLRPLEAIYIEQLTRTLAPAGGLVLWRREPGHTLAVQIALDGDRYWLTVPGRLPGRAFSRTWLLGSGITALLAIAGAWLIQQRLNQPLQRVTEAAAALSRGQMPPPLPEDGPVEIATVAKGFNQMVSSLARQDQERALMLAGLSHDLRTPLTKMRLVTEMLQGQGDPALLSSLERSMDGLSHLLMQFTDFTHASHAGAGTTEAPALVDANDLVREMVALCVLEGSSPDDLQLDLGPLPLMGLPVMAFRRCLLNLITNAQRHGAPPLEVATSSSQGQLCIEVRDRGPGIPPDQIEVVRRPFAQGNVARAHQQPGAGLGLAIVDGLVKAYRGSLTLWPREGGGLIARMNWPLAGPARQ